MNGRVYESDVEAHIKNARLPNNPDLQKKSAQFFLDLAQKAEFLPTPHVVRCLNHLLFSRRDSTRALSARAIALFLGSGDDNRKTQIRRVFADNGIIDCLTKCLMEHDVQHSVLEACLFALDRLTSIKSCVIQLRTPKVRQAVLRLIKDSAGGVQCNALALMGSLIYHAPVDDIDAVIVSGILPRLFDLRSELYNRDIRRNVSILLDRLGYNDNQPTIEESKLASELRSLGLDRGHIDLALRRNDSREQGVIMQYIFDYLDRYPINSHTDLNGNDHDRHGRHDKRSKSARHRPGHRHPAHHHGNHHNDRYHHQSASPAPRDHNHHSSRDHNHSSPKQNTPRQSRQTGGRSGSGQFPNDAHSNFSPSALRGISHRSSPHGHMNGGGGGGEHHDYNAAGSHSPYPEKPKLKGGRSDSSTSSRASSSYGENGNVPGLRQSSSLEGSTLGVPQPVRRLSFSTPRSPSLGSVGSVSPGQIEKLVDMGFERSNVREALERCNGSIDHAIVRLLDQDAHAQPSTPGPGSLAYPSQSTPIRPATVGRPGRPMTHVRHGSVPGDAPSPTILPGPGHPHVHGDEQKFAMDENGLPIVNRRHVGPSTLPSHERSPSTPPVIRTRVVRDRLITQMLRETNLLEHEEKFVEHAVEMRHMLGQSKQELEHFLNEVGIKALGPRFAMITWIQKRAKRNAEQEIHMAVLYANPLTAAEVPGQSRVLSFEEERSILQEQITQSRRALKFLVSVATPNNFVECIRRGPRILHFSGHGRPQQSLLMEAGNGGEQDLTVDRLKSVMQLAMHKLKFVFISSCHSSHVANAFVQAGVPHVIGVHNSTRIKDSTALLFFQHVYRNLLDGHTVQEAFHAGQAGVAVHDEKSPCCCFAHVHRDTCVVCPVCGAYTCCKDESHSMCHQSTSCCMPDTPHNENHKFLLLPKHGDHSVTILGDLPQGKMVDMTPKLPLLKIKRSPDRFQGRAKEMRQIIELILHNRIVTVIGPPGIGATSVVRAVGSYLHERALSYQSYNKFRDGIFEVSIRKGANVHELVRQIAHSQGFRFRKEDSNLESMKHSLFKTMAELHILFILDPIDFSSPDVPAAQFDKFFQDLFSSTRFIKVVCTSSSLEYPPRNPSVPGVQHKVHELQPLHKLDAAFLLDQRMTRSLLKTDFPPDAIPRSRDELSNHPLFVTLHGNPRLIEHASSILGKVELRTLYEWLNEFDDNLWSWSENVGHEVINEVKHLQNQSEQLSRYYESSRQHGIGVRMG